MVRHSFARRVTLDHYSNAESIRGAGTEDLDENRKPPLQEGAVIGKVKRTLVQTIASGRGRALFQATEQPARSSRKHADSKLTLGSYLAD